jgi:hypothetical protein
MTIMKNVTKKDKAKAMLVGVSRNQFVNVFKGVRYAAYATLCNVSDTTDSKFFIATPTSPDCNKGFWVNKSDCTFTFETDIEDDSIVRVSFQYSVE